MALFGYTLMAPAAADELAASLNGEDEFTYEAMHDPLGTGQSFVRCLDVDGEEICRI